jgi:hypothetical protein
MSDIARGPRCANSPQRARSDSLSFALLAGKLTLRLTLQPIIDVLAHHIPGQAIALLDDSFELLAPSVDRGQIVIGKLTPLLFDLALCLFPISFDAVPVHSRHLQKSGCPLARGKRCDVPDSSDLKSLGSMDRPEVGRGAHLGYPAFIAALLLPL